MTQPDRVVVVGDGVAAASAAIEARRLGTAVVVVRRSVRTAYRPGESLSPASVGVLTRLAGREVLRGGRPYDGHEVTSPRAERHTFGGGATGLHLDRRELERRLFARAERVGAHIVTGRVEAPIRCGDRVAGVRLIGGDEYVASTVIDATGRAGWLGRALGVERRRVGPRQFAAYGVVASPRLAALDARPTFSADERGWWWVAPVQPDRLAWVRVDVHGGRPTIPASLRGAPELEPSRAADVTWSTSARPCGPGWFAVGDAAHCLDPSAAGGVGDAAVSAALAVRLGVDIRRGRLVEHEANAAYATWCRDQFDRAVQTLRVAAGCLPNPPTWAQRARWSVA